MFVISLILAPVILATPVPPAPSAPLGSGAGRIAIFRGPAAGPGDVVVVDPNGAMAHELPTELQDIRLLPLEVNGRTALERLRPGAARRMDDLPGASRIALPAGAGSLYHYARDVGALTRFGYFVVDASGDARSLIEHDGTGAASDQDPWLERVAVSPDGLAVLAATRKPAGGDLFVVGLDGVVTSPTGSLAPQPFSPRGLALCPTWGVASTGRALFRFDRTGAGDATPVPFAELPPWFGGEVVTSRNGAWAATIGGVDELAAHAFVFGPSGTATRADATPRAMSGAGFLPDALDGPYLAVSDDGASCAWRTEEPASAGESASREGFVKRLDAPANAATQITADVNFIDTLDEIGEFIFLPFSGTLMVAVGEVGPLPNTIEGLDFYTVDLAPDGTPVFANVSGSSGDVEAPFTLPSEIDAIGTLIEPGSERILLYDEGGNSGPLIAVDAVQGTTTILDNVRDLFFVERAGDALVFGVNRSVNGNDRLEIHTLASGAPTTQLLGSPASSGTLDQALAGPNGRVAFVRSTLTAEFVWMADSAAASLSVLTTRPLIYGPALAFTEQGILALTVGDPDGSTVKIGWDPAGAVMRLPVGPGSGFVLPGS